MQDPAPSSGPAHACARCGLLHAPDGPCEGAPTLLFGEPAPAAILPPPEVDPLLGSQVGSFRVARLLGRGGMGTVYLAEHPVIGSRVAVKFLHESMSSDPAAVARFYDEARAVNLIGHENIVGIFDLSVLPSGRYFFVMEYLEGETLHALVRAGSVPPRAAKEVLLQVCDALQRAHDRGVVHRDMKPENVFLVRRRGKAHFVKIVDFGIAKLRDAGRTGRTASGLIVGTPEYMAPEQCEDGTIDARTDVYAVGVMAYELVTGRLPFQSRSVPQLLLAHVRDEPPRPSSIAPVSAELERVILRALAKDPGARFQTMDAFAAALEAAPFAEAAGGARAASAPATAALTPPPVLVPRPPPGLAALSAVVRVPGAPPASVAAVGLTPGGMFVRAGALPPLQSRAAVVLSHPSLRSGVELQAEVVRHVGPAEAAAWKMEAGFALQFLDPPPEARAALAQLAALSDDGAPPPAGPPRPSAPGIDERLAALEARRAGGHYALLGLAQDAEFADVRRALRELGDELEEVRSRPLAAEHPGRAAALLAALEAAREALGSPAARLAHDARRGNHGGVDRCLKAGVPEALVEARRREILAAEPGRAAEAQRQLARAEVARKLGNPQAAAAAYEAALAADPLDPAARAAYAAFRRS